MQLQTPAWKWVAAITMMLAFAAAIYIPARHGAHAAEPAMITTDEASYDSIDPDLQATKPSPFPEKPARRHSKPVEIGSPDTR